MTSLQPALLALALVSGSLVAQASQRLAASTIGVKCDLTSSGSNNYWGISEEEKAAEAADQICGDLLVYLRHHNVLSAWDYVANQSGIGGTMTFRIGPRPARGQCHQLRLEFRTEESSKTLFDEPLYDVGDRKCYSDPERSEFQEVFATGFLDKMRIQVNETEIIEYLKARVPLLATEGLDIRLSPNAERADFFCCQLEWERYRKLRESYFALNTSLDVLMTAQGTNDPRQEQGCSAKHLVLTVCEDPAAVAAILQRSQRQSVRTEILLKQYIDPEPRIYDSECDID